MKKTNKKIGKYLIAPIVSLFTLVTIGASVGFSPSGSLGSLGNSIAKAKMETAEAFSVLKGATTKIEGNDEHSAAIFDGKLFMWGKNHQGQLGNNSTDNKNKPVYVDVDGDKNPNNDNVLDVSLGQYHSVARTSSGVYAWGWNLRGQLGLGNFDTRYTTPQKVTALSEIPTQISTGFSHTTVLTSSGMYTWGYNANGQLGLGTTTEKYNTPQKVTISGTPTKISAGESHSAAVTSSGLYTWGLNTSGQLGLNNTTDFNTPQQVSIPGGTPTHISMGGLHSAAVTSSGLYTWGKNSDSQLGLEDTTNRLTPQPVTISGTPTQISMGETQSLAITTTGAYAWGKNNTGQLGFNDSNTRRKPEKITLLPGTPTQISSGKFHSIFITSSGVYTCGSNSAGQLGTGNNTQYRKPELVDHSSNFHKDLNILDLTTVTDSESLKNRTTHKDDTKEDNLINLIKNNNSILFDKYTSNSKITVKDVERVASYKVDDVLLGKINLTFNNNMQCDSWVGYQNTDGVEFAIGNVDKKITITKFKKSETENISKIEVKEHDKTYSVDDLVEEIGPSGKVPNRDALNKFLDFKDFPSDMKVTKVEYILETPRTNVLSLDLTVDKYTEEGSTGETVTLVTPTLYEGIKIEN
ncbi:MAG: RCC1 domain-containing protein, partial [Mycoplasma sp.]